MNKENLYHSLYVLFFNLSIISALLFLLSSFQIINVPNFLSNNTLFGTLILFTGLSILNKSKLNELRHLHGNSIKTLLEISPYFFSSLLIILAINQFLNLEIISDRMFNIIIIAVFFGFFSFYPNRNIVENKLEQQKQKEEDEEKQRYHDFEYKFPTLNRIWGLKQIVRWMYKEGWVYSIGLLIIIAIGVFLRTWKLNGIGLTFDEVFQVFAVKSIGINILPTFGEGLYLRGILISYTGKIFSLFFNELLSSRLPVVLAGCAIIPLIYLISKNIGLSKKYAILATILTSLELMLIQFSRISRFYVISCFLMILIINLFIKKNKPPIKKLIILITLSFLSEISLTIFLLAALITAYLLANIRESKNNKNFIFLLLASTIAIFTSFIIYMFKYQRTFLERIITLNLDANYYSKYFSWIFNTYNSVMVLAITISIAMLFSNKKKTTLVTFFLTFLIILFATNLVDYNYTIRSFIILIPIMIILAVMGLSNLENKIPKWQIILIILLIILPITSDLRYLPLNYGDHYHPEKIIYEKLPLVLDWENPSQFIKENYLPGDLLISHAVNPYFLEYYTGARANLSVRNIGTSRSIDGKYYDQYSSILVTDSPYELENLILDSIENNKRVWILSSGTNWGIKNQFYLKYFGKEIVLESPSSISQYLEAKREKLVYIGKDGLTKVYLFSP